MMKTFSHNVGAALHDMSCRAFKRRFGADVIVITDDGHKLDAHQCILAKSPVLLELFMKEEIRYLIKPVIILSGFNSKCVETFIQFLYTGEVNLSSNKSFNDDFIKLCGTFKVNPSAKASKVDEMSLPPSTSSAGNGNEERGDKQSSSTSSRRCPECRTRFKSRESLKFHRRSDHGIDDRDDGRRRRHEDRRRTDERRRPSSKSDRSGRVSMSSPVENVDAPFLTTEVASPPPTTAAPDPAVTGDDIADKHLDHPELLAEAATTSADVGGTTGDPQAATAAAVEDQVAAAVEVGEAYELDTSAAKETTDVSATFSSESCPEVKGATTNAGVDDGEDEPDLQIDEATPQDQDGVHEEHDLLEPDMEIDPDQSTDAGEEEEFPVQGDDSNPDRVDLFGLPDNFDFSEEYIRELKSREPVNIEPNESINDDPATTKSLILESPLMPTESDETDKSPSPQKTDERVNKKLTFDMLADSAGSILSQQKAKTLSQSLQKEIEAKRLRTMNKFRRREIENFDDNNVDKKKTLSTKARKTLELVSGGRPSSGASASSRRRNKSRNLDEDSEEDDGFIVFTDELDTDDSWIENDVSSSFDEDRPWSAEKALRKSKKQRRKKRRMERSKKLIKERHSTSSTDEEDDDDNDVEEEEEVVKVWSKRGAKMSARPSVKKLKVSVQNQPDPIMELNQYRLLQMNENESSDSSAPVKSKKKEFAEKVTKAEVIGVKKRNQSGERTLKRIARLCSSSSDSDDQQPEQKPEADISSRKASSKKSRSEDKVSDESESDFETKKKTKSESRSEKGSAKAEKRSGYSSNDSPHKKFKRSQSLDASKWKKSISDAPPSLFSRQLSVQNQSKAIPKSSIQYNYGLSTENKLLAEKRAKEPDELDKILKKSFKKKIDSTSSPVTSPTKATTSTTSPSGPVRTSVAPPAEPSTSSTPSSAPVTPSASVTPSAAVAPSAAVTPVTPVVEDLLGSIKAAMVRTDAQLMRPAGQRPQLAQAAVSGFMVRPNFMPRPSAWNPAPRQFVPMRQPLYPPGPRPPYTPSLYQQPRPPFQSGPPRPMTRFGTPTSNPNANTSHPYSSGSS